MWWPYPIELDARPRAARVWFGMFAPRTNHVLVVRVAGHVMVVPLPATGNPHARPVRFKPASTAGAHVSIRDGEATVLNFEQERPPCYVGRDIPAAWLVAGRNVLEITSALLDGTDSCDTGPAVWAKALSVK